MVESIFEKVPAAYTVIYENNAEEIIWILIAISILFLQMYFIRRSIRHLNKIDVFKTIYSHIKDDLS